MTLKIDISCPISLDTFSAPVISPCGHTFDFPYICQHLEHKAKCPLDRKPLTVEQLRSNPIIKDLTSVLNNIAAIFISTHEQAPTFKHRCVLSRELLTNPAVLPCHDEHPMIFNESSLIKFSWSRMKSKLGVGADILFKENATLEEFATNKGVISCPACNTEYEPTEIIKNQEWLTELKLKAAEEYVGFLQRLKLFNAALAKRVETENLDDRSVVTSILTCPISKKIFKDPLVAKCGHTFDKSSFAMPGKCPHDEVALSLEEAIPNLLVKDTVDRLNAKVSSIFCDLPHSEDISGTWLYLKKGSSIKRIKQIMRQLGFYQVKPPSAPLFATAGGYNLKKGSSIKRIKQITRQLGFYQVKPPSAPLLATAGGYNLNVYDYLNDCSSILEKDPVIRRTNRLMY
ncbi:U-box domain-containing protein [Parachlamydia sp. AcF125]|uniref:U-box domain-containing protein n=1 Tax=Parachlamydia sp. AcF125 TaxID=2795736 RepID=UPI001BC9B7DD|nr:U-box domain-containing protein [Parachlamydia sp. AcF125]MBS4168978.1 hypothetical protein [Parachlamydia sp. AcF125]